MFTGNYEVVLNLGGSFTHKADLLGWFLLLGLVTYQ